MESAPRGSKLAHGLLVVLSIALFCIAVFLADQSLMLAALPLLAAIAAATEGLRLTPKEIRAREGRLLAASWLFFGLLTGIFAPITTHDGGDPRTACLSNTKQIALAMQMYAVDYDDRFPLAPSWHRELEPYTKNEGLFHCPVATSPWSYAMNLSLPGANGATLKDPDQHVLLFEANAALPNASGGREWLAPRHPKGETTKANIAFADGHAKAYTFADTAQLKW